MASFYAHKTTEAFLAEGYELTILDTAGEQEDCAICTRPIYKPKCDSDGRSHNHDCCSSEQEVKPNPAAIKPFFGEFPEPGLKIKACGHVLGHRCALKWFENANSCPFCRRKLFASEKDWKEQFAHHIALLDRLIAEDEVSALQL
jgi:hypothetical protein